ncbi:hypothetical protein ACHAQA_007436 [Verticillium albo-atrum]
MLLRRVFLTASVVLLTTSHSALALTIKGQEFPSLINVTIDDLSQGLKAGLFTSVDLVEAYLARIAEVNGEFKALTEINPDALSIAAELDAQRANGAVLGPLHGIPILIKDNIATKDRMNNTAGSWALVGAEVPEDSFVAKKLREGGAVILGKANMSQWANARSSNSSNGWSAYGGQGTGAYYPDMDPFGSSSGSGVATALGLSLAALGTETVGSIIAPAQRSNLVGIKPTVGLTSRHLVIPISEHLDTVGPIARTVKDAAVILNAIAGVDPNDNYTSAIPNCGKIPDYVAACNEGALKGARIGVPWNFLEPFIEDSPPWNAFFEALDLMAAQGAEVVDANFTVPFGETTTGLILEVDLLTNLAEYLAGLSFNPYDVADLEELRAFTQNYTLEEYPDRDTGFWDGALERGFDNTDIRFWEALQTNYNLGGEGGLLGAVERNDLDAVVMPTDGAAGPAALRGAPAITVPLGFWPEDTNVVTSERGLVMSGPNIPFGISFLGGLFTEETLVALAYAFEQKTHVRDQVQPYVVPKAEIGDYLGSE